MSAKSEKMPNFALQTRKDAGVVDRGGLENRCALTGTQGSNPCLSAYKSCKPKLAALLRRKAGMRA